MTSAWASNEREWQNRVAAALRASGYEVIIEPSPKNLPFELNGYRPDLLATRDDEGLIVEIKRTENRLSIDRFVEIAALVKQHTGWRFILIPVEQADDANLRAAWSVPSVDQIRKRSEAATFLLNAEQFAPAFITAWSGIEGWLRKSAIDNAIPVTSMSPVSMFKHLYTQGLLAPGQLQLLERLLPVRNALVHGLEDPRAAEFAPIVVELLRKMLSEESSAWPAF